jgi:hypothetical protein
MKPYVVLLKNTSVNSDLVITHGLVDGEESISKVLRLYPKMSHCSNARFFDEQTFTALIKAVRAGIFGRGSLGRFHVCIVGLDTWHLIPLFCKGGIGWVPDRECVMALHTLCTAEKLSGPGFQ